MIYALVVLAVVLFVLWLLLHLAGSLINLLWIVMIALIGLWLFGFERKTSSRPQRSA